MARRLLVLDFDRTLLDQRLAGDFLALLEREGLIEPEDVRQIGEVLGERELVDLAHELTAHGVNLEAATDIARSAFKPNQFLFDDVMPLLDRADAASLPVVIMTTGGEAWQTVKLSLCQGISTYQHIILPGNKGEHLAAELGRDRSGLKLEQLPGIVFDKLILVDDRLENLLPLLGRPDAELWYVNRTGGKYSGRTAPRGIQTVNSLKEIIL